MYLHQLHQAWYSLSLRSKLALLLVGGAILPTLVVTQAIVNLAQGKFVQTEQGMLPIQLKALDNKLNELKKEVALESQKLSAFVESHEGLISRSEQLVAGRNFLSNYVPSTTNKSFYLITDVQERTVAQYPGHREYGKRDAMEQLSESFSQTLTPRVQQVSYGMEGQSQGAVQISDAMVQLSEASCQTADSLREINGAIAQLNEAAQGLRQEISRFQVAKD